MKQHKHGGERKGAGRHLMYGEPTKRKNFSYPASKEKDFFKAVADILKKWMKRNHPADKT